MEQYWHKCKIWWVDFWKWFFANVLRKVWFFYSFCNFLAWFSILYQIKKQKPDIIWRNSCLRVLWWFPLYITRHFSWQQWMMYHDLWYFHPFPSKVNQEQQIPTKRSVKNFLDTLDVLNFSIIKKTLIKPFVVVKFFLLTLLKKQLQKNIDLHLVPSSFMQKYMFY